MTTLPQPVVQVSFSTKPLETASWTDISADLVDNGFSVRRGRADKTTVFGAGSASFVLLDPTGKYDPENTSSPYYPNVRTMKQVRIGLTWNSVTYWIFTGYIQTWTPSFDVATGMPICRVDCLDAIGAIFSRRKLGGETILNAVPAAPSAYATSASATSSYPISVQPLPQPGNRKIRASLTGFVATSGGISVRVTGTLANAGTPLTQTIALSGSNPNLTTTLNFGRLDMIEIFPTSASDFALADIGKPLIVSIDGAMPPEFVNHGINTLLKILDWPETLKHLSNANTLARSYNVSGGSIWSYLNLLNDTESGRLFVDRLGRVVFQNRQYSAVNQATFGQGSGQIDWQDLVVDHGERYIFNSARTNHPVENYSVADQDSIAEYGAREYPQRQTVQSIAREAYDQIAYAVHIHRQQQPYVARLVPDLDNWPTLLSAELCNRYQIVRNGITQQVSLEFIAITYSAAHDLKIEFQFSPDASQMFWLLGVSGRSELDSTTTLGY